MNLLSKLYEMNILGGSKILCQMAVDGTEKGMRNAAQALSRIGITQDPSIAFPGNRVWILIIWSLFLNYAEFKCRMIQLLKISPSFYFKSCDIVRPLCNLLNIEYSGIENFEALMALGNLAGMNEPTRKRILKVKLIHSIEYKNQLSK